MAFVGGGERGIASFFRQLGRLRVREVPEFLRKTVTRESIQSNGEKYLEYREKYIKTGSHSSGVSRDGRRVRDGVRRDVANGIQTL